MNALTAELLAIGTQMNKRKSGMYTSALYDSHVHFKVAPRPKQSNLSTEERPSNPEPEQSQGWLWDLGKMTKMTDEEMNEWSEEGMLKCC